MQERAAALCSLPAKERWQRAGHWNCSRREEPSSGEKVHRKPWNDVASAYDKSGSTRATFGMGVPVTWFIDETGKVVHKKYGPFNSTEEVQLAVAKYLGK